MQYLDIILMYCNTTVTYYISLIRSKVQDKLDVGFEKKKV